MNLPINKDGTIRFWYLSLFVFALPLVTIIIQMLDATGGVFVYPIDDTYIHLAVAKNLVNHHTWGVSGHEFASASSSVSYPIILSGIFLLTGVQTIVPFVVNVLAALAFMYVLKKWMDRQELGLTEQLIVMIGTILLTPLPTIVLVGMEHTLHLLFFFLFLTSFAESITKGTKLPWTTYLWAALLIATRFEGLPAVALACLLLLVQRKWVAAIQLGFVGVLPVLVFGAISTAHNGFFLPNAVVLKPQLPPLNAGAWSAYFSNQLIPRLFKTTFYTTLAIQRLLIIIPLVFLVFLQRFKEKSEFYYLLALLMGVSFVHVAVAVFSAHLRYEAYLAGTAIPILLTVLVKFRPRNIKDSLSKYKLALVVLGLFLLGPFLTRSWTAFSNIGLGSVWIHDQQYQMGQFVHQYYDTDGVTFNDIGAVSYYSEGKKLDILGLGNNEVAHWRHDRGDLYLRTSTFNDSLARLKNIRVGVIYEPTLKAYTEHWKKVASWEIPFDNPIPFYDSVSWYAVDTAEAGNLSKNLKKYQARMPKEIVVRYY
jgi:hypothetical protein